MSKRHWNIGRWQFMATQFWHPRFFNMKLLAGPYDRYIGLGWFEARRFADVREEQEADANE